MNDLINTFASIIALALFIGDQVTGDETLIPQFKVVSVKQGYHDPNYMDKIETHIVKHNATYNNVQFSWEQVQDMPLEAKISYKIFASDSEYKSRTLVLADSLMLCSSENADIPYYPDGLREYSATDKCLPKNTYKTDNIGIARLDLLVRHVLEISDYFIVENFFTYKGKVLNVFTFYSEWGYLHTNETTE